LGEAASMLRGPLGRSLGLRHAPELRFEPDELIEQGVKLTSLINEAVKSDAERHVDEDK
jgi:ribosome-binding factor A